ncbi:hypothetical protein FRB93_004329 [Tulasnella sp. JGI-2019a]|nr:hypothetical protein FRB93_004329 [Tulasnella sp. JGI-2019a]
MLARSKQLLDEFDISNHPMTKFIPGDSRNAHVGDDYFLNSGDKIRFFLEEDAVGSDGKLDRPKELAVNKIGHALHELDPIFRRVTLENQKLKSLARDLKFHKDPAVLQSMTIFKQPRIGGKVPEHNDRQVYLPLIAFTYQYLTKRPMQTYQNQHIPGELSLTILVYHFSYNIIRNPQYTNPVSALGFWFALEDCTPSNGALSFAPGSHLTHPIDRRFVRTGTGGTGFETLCAPGPPLREEDYVMHPCPAGTLVVIHGSVLHKSERNTSEKTRYAYTFHMIESAPPAVYDEKNWLQPTREMPFSKLFAAS